MFFEGGLQAGISHALSENKVVACFVRDDSSESSDWEDWLLHDETVCYEMYIEFVIANIHSAHTKFGDYCSNTTN
jgi:hypothetical protein